LPPKRWLILAIVAGASWPSNPQARSPIVATSISATSRSIARTTAAPTSAGVFVPAPSGSFTPLSANIPASAIPLGKMHDALTPVPFRS
jgi:hypothetical protein